jgi:hypothetical protein
VRHSSLSRTWAKGKQTFDQSKSLADRATTGADIEQSAAAIIRIAAHVRQPMR